MVWRAREPLKVFTRSAPLRRRVAYSLAIVRLILVPVIFLAIYYLFAMGWIVDRIVSAEAPVASLAERASTEMLDARRAEQNYFLLHDPADMEANRRALSSLEEILASCRELQPEEKPTIELMQVQVKRYRQRFEQAVSRTEDTTQAPVERIRRAVRAYERDLDELLKRTSRQSRAQTVEDLRTRIGSFDAEVAATLEAENPDFRRTSQELRAASQQILNLADQLEKRSWDRVNRDHQEARNLVRRAEWVLGIVSALTLLLSVWVSFTLPRQVVKPLADLKEAVDHAAAGNYEIEFEVQGEGEVAQLANSVRKLIAHLRERQNNSGRPASP
jgi:methyl-accepting chemotaxis protein